MVQNKNIASYALEFVMPAIRLSAGNAHAHTIVQEFSRARVAQGISRSKLARLAGYPEVTMANWENGRTTPSLRAADDLANALGFRLSLTPLENTP